MRLNYNTFAARKGATIKCSKCDKEIAKGERYSWFKPGFRSRYKVIRCMQHPPRPSEMTNSKMSGVLAAGETATDALDVLDGQDPEQDTSSIESILTDAASEIESVADEYREAAEASPTGMIFGEDYNERADEIADKASTLEQWHADDEEPDFDGCSDPSHEPEDLAPDAEPDPDYPQHDRGSEDCEGCVAIRQEWWDGVIQSARDAVDEATSY